MERMQVYRMKLEVMKHQEKRVNLEKNLTSRQVNEKLSWVVAKVDSDAIKAKEKINKTTKCLAFFKA
jgi:hypothetical protein